jgi:glucose/arabinose dehydrogenase
MSGLRPISLCLLLLCLAIVPPADAQPARAPLCFNAPGISNCIDGRFREYWEQNGGLPVFGYPISAAANRQTAEGTFLTQSFERNRFELHPEKTAPYDVLLGRLGDDRLRQQGRDWRTLPRGSQSANCLWFGDTRHSVCDQEPGIGFRAFWSTHGLQDAKLDGYQRSLALFGMPLSEPTMETNAAGDRVLTQWFERARLEYHPSKPREFKVLLGLLGNETGGAAPSNPPAPPDPGFNPGSFTLTLDRVPGDFDNPTHVAHAGDGSGRLFVIEKAGRIRVISGGAARPQPFLDITDRVGSDSSERGLFSVAFHPDYRSNGFFYVDYTDKAGDSVIARFHVSGDPNVADRGSATTILTIKQPYPNHNGGQIAFGRDGYLYIGMGDGGGAGDPQGNAQNLGTLLGKMLRIDINRGNPYAVPPDNPFVGAGGARAEIWALGLRNPWRFSFDRATGDLFIADVGQSKLEEIDWAPAGSRGGQNYGWNRMEGRSCYKPATGCDQNGLEQPIAQYGRDSGCSITGGFRYRGREVPAFGSAYFFADFCSGRIWGLTPRDGGGWNMAELLKTDLRISSFGQDERGELLVADLAGGGVYRLGARNK